MIRFSNSNCTQKSRIYTHVLTPLNQSRWEVVRESIRENPSSGTPDIDVPPAMEIENDGVCVDDTTPDDGIILDAGREVRAKLYLGQV